MIHCPKNPIEVLLAKIATVNNVVMIMERSFRGCGKADPPEERLAKVVAGVRFVRLPKPYTYCLLYTSPSPRD